jgi:hypothetical protein
MLVSLVLWYHLSMFSKPASIASTSSLNLAALAMVPHICCKNSMTGIVRQMAGSRELENDCCALAGSCHQKSALSSVSVERAERAQIEAGLTFITSCRSFSCSHSSFERRNRRYFLLRKAGTSSLSSASCMNRVMACACISTRYWHACV